MSTFLLSGLLHSYVAHFAFGHGAATAMLFFILHGGACVLEGYATRNVPAYTKHVPAIVRAHITTAFVVATLPLYLSLFVDSMPEWISEDTTASLPTRELSIALFNQPFVHHLLTSFVVNGK